MTPRPPPSTGTGAAVTDRSDADNAAQLLKTATTRKPHLSDQAARSIKKNLRTLQTCFPALIDAKFAAMRMYRRVTRSPFEYDFKALALFPEIDGDYLDVGANRGQSSDAILMHRPRARIQLFEPNAILFEKLRRIFGSNPRLMLHHLGLGDQDTTAELNVPFYNGWMFDGLGSFNHAEAREWLRHRMHFYRDRKLRVERLTCRIVRLDALRLKPWFVKLDIQGFELRALKGGEQTLRTHRPVLLIESPDDDTIQYLSELGYDFYAFVDGRFISNAIGAPNTFFMTPDRAGAVEKHVVRRGGPVVRL